MEKSWNISRFHDFFLGHFGHVATGPCSSQVWSSTLKSAAASLNWVPAIVGLALLSGPDSNNSNLHVEWALFMIGAKNV